MISCTTVDGVREVFCREIARHGYTASACRIVVPVGGATRPRVLFRNWPDGWANLSDRKGFSAKSFVMAEARKRITPFTWLEAKEARILSPGERETWEAALAWGWKTGFVVPVHGPGGYCASVSMASREDDLDLGPAQRSRLYLLAMLAHERCQALVDPKSIDTKHALSAREIECLRWVAAGKTDWEIGKIVSISATTVKFHVNNARAKLKARTRAQAVALMILEGLY